MSICATSHSDTRWRCAFRAASGRRRATWTARTGADRSGSGSARMSPPRNWIREPNMTGTYSPYRSPPKITAASSASAVQPT